MRSAIRTLAASCLLAVGSFGNSGLPFVHADDTVATTRVASTPSVEIVGVATLPGDLRDKTGLKEVLANGTPHDQFGGISGLEWQSGSDLYFGLSDRGPQDGAVDYACRFHVLRINLPKQAGDRVTAEVLASTLLVDQKKLRFPGAADAIAAQSNRGRRLDPEGIRIDRSGDLWISDEYGPYLLRFQRDGRLVSETALPKSWQVAQPSANPADEDKNNASGRRSNRGLEGIAVTPSGRYLVGLLQSPLLQDAELDAKGKKVGLNARLVRIDLQTGKQQQFVYRQELPNHKMHEILAINETEFLVIEQCGEPGAKATCKQVMRISLADATEIADEQVLPAGELPETIRPVAKSLLLDMLSPEFGLAGDNMPEKIEGLCWGPKLADGRRTLIISSDNDFKSEQPTQFFVFAISME